MLCHVNSLEFLGRESQAFESLFELDELQLIAVVVGGLLFGWCLRRRAPSLLLLLLLRWLVFFSRGSIAKRRRKQATSSSDSSHLNTRSSQVQIGHRVHLSDRRPIEVVKVNGDIFSTSL